MLQYLYVTEDQARAYGLTNEGTLFGVPMWMGDISEDSFVGVPKVPVLTYYTEFMTFAFAFLAHQFGVDVNLPHTIGRSIEDDGSSAAV